THREGGSPECNKDRSLDNQPEQRKKCLNKHTRIHHTNGHTHAGIIQMVTHTQASYKWSHTHVTHTHTHNTHSHTHAHTTHIFTHTRHTHTHTRHTHSHSHRDKYTHTPLVVCLFRC